MKQIEQNILAEGEQTGHYHQAIGEGVAVMESENGERTLFAPNGAEIVHQEHKPIKIPAGEYERLIVQEYDPFEKEVRSVMD